METGEIAFKLFYYFVKISKYQQKINKQNNLNNCWKKNLKIVFDKTVNTVKLFIDLNDLIVYEDVLLRIKRFRYLREMIVCSIFIFLLMLSELPILTN